MKKIAYLLSLLIILCFSYSCGSSSSGGGSNGEPVEILTKSIPPGQSGEAYEFKIEVSGGSGEYQFTASGLPAGLAISNDGLITGTINIDPSSHTLTIKVSDINYENNSAVLELNFDILLLAPDAYEPDNDFPKIVGTKGPEELNDYDGNVMVPGDEFQAHTIHISGDTDYVVLDMTGVSAGDQILIRADYLVLKQNIYLQLFNFSQQLVASVNNNEGHEYSELIFTCENPGIYYLKIDEFFGNIGEYDLTVQNTKDIIIIKPETLEPGYVGREYNTQISATGGSGNYEFASIGLPKNLFIDAETGIISGEISDASGIYIVEVTITDGDFGKTETKTYDLTIYNDLIIETETLPDAKAEAQYSELVSASGGSGNYTFSAVNLPSNLTMDAGTGRISGMATDILGARTITCYVTDNETDLKVEKNLTLRVVQYLPDTYEEDNNDDIATTETVISPGETQEHNFHDAGDLDYIKLDLSEITAGDVILITTELFENVTDTNLTLYSPDRTLISSNNDYGLTLFSRLVYVCENPGVYYIAVSNAQNILGDYKVKITNTGPKLTITTNSLPDILKTQTLIETIHVTYGSGDFTYTLENQPANLTISEEGVLSGTIGVGTGSYTFIVRVRDNVYDEMVDEVYLTLNVVDYFKDVFEDDNNMASAKDISIGETQERNFNNVSDEDFIRLDLTSISSGNVILIETSFLLKQTNTNITLFNSDGDLIDSDNNSGEDNYSLIAYECSTPAIYFIYIRESNQETGDYRISVTDTGAKLNIETIEMDDALKNSPYSFQLSVSGGSGNYRYIANNLPGTLTINQEGIVSGNITAVPDSYSVLIRIEDLSYPGIFVEKLIPLEVVHFYPDENEPNGEFESAAEIQVGTEYNCTLNTQGDDDFYVVDLSAIDPGNIIKIETDLLSENTDTVLTLYDSERGMVETDNNDGDTEYYSKIILECNSPGIYYIQVGEMYQDFGDYKLKVTDCGPQLNITTANLPDALINNFYSTTISTTGGSGGYTYTLENIPENLSISQAGIISGDVNVSPGDYFVNITASDSINPENRTTKTFNIKVVEFFPDGNEPNNNYLTATNIGVTQVDVNFHEESDQDYFLVDLSSVAAGNVIVFETSTLTKSTDTYLTLYNQAQSIIDGDDNSGEDNYSQITYTLQTPGIFYVKIENTHNIGLTGDCIFSVTDVGPKLSLVSKELLYSESVTPYNQVITCTGGNGSSKNRYIVQSGSLPPGLTISELTGQITGTNYQNGTFDFNIKVYDADYPENSDTKSFSITAYMGIKISANDIVKQVTWGEENTTTQCGSISCTIHNYPRKISIIMNPEVQATNEVVFEEYSIPENLSVWKTETYTENGVNYPKYNFNTSTGRLSAVFQSFETVTNIYGTSVVADNDMALIRESTPTNPSFSGAYLKHTLIFKVYDKMYPDNYDTFTYTIDMTE